MRNYFVGNLTVQAAWTSGWGAGRERLPVRSHTVSSVRLGRSLELPPKSEANVMKSSRNLDSSEETEVNVQSANFIISLWQNTSEKLDPFWEILLNSPIGSVLLKNDMSPGCLNNLDQRWMLGNDNVKTKYMFWHLEGGFSWVNFFESVL